MSKAQHIKKIIGGVEVDSHTTLEAAGRPIVFLIRVGTATCSRSMDSGGVEVDSHTTVEQCTPAGKGGVDVDSHTTLEQNKILKIFPQALLRTLQTVDFHWQNPQNRSPSSA